MKTQPVIRITESGAVECNHTYPIEPVPYGIGDEQYYGARMDEYYKACKEAEAGFLPVTNEMTAANYLAQYHCLTIAVTDGKPEWKYVTKGIYPYTGEVKIEEKPIINYQCCIVGYEKVATLVEPKPELKGRTEGHITADECLKSEQKLRKFSEKIQELREANTKLQKFKEYVHDRLDKMGIPADPEPDSNKAHGCRIEGRLNYIEEQIKEQQGIIKTYIHANEHNRICGEADAKTISQLREANKELVEALKEAIEEMDESKIKYYQHIITKHSNL